MDTEAIIETINEVKNDVELLYLMIAQSTTLDADYIREAFKKRDAICTKLIDLRDLIDE